MSSSSLGARLADALADGLVDLIQGTTQVLPGAVVAVLAALVTAGYTERRERLAQEREDRKAAAAETAAIRARTFEQGRQAYEDLLVAAEHLYDVYGRAVEEEREPFDDLVVDANVKKVRDAQARLNVYGSDEARPSVTGIASRVTAFMDYWEADISVLDPATPEEEQRVGRERLYAHRVDFKKDRDVIRKELGVR